MKRRKRIIQDGFPTGSLDLEELGRVFRELRAKRLARERRARGLSSEGSSETRAIRKQARSASVDAAGERDRAA